MIDPIRLGGIVTGSRGAGVVIIRGSLTQTAASRHEVRSRLRSPRVRGYLDGTAAARSTLGRLHRWLMDRRRRPMSIRSAFTSTPSEIRMRAWLTRGAVAAVLGITVCLPAASDELEERASSPTGEVSAEAPSLREPDLLFDDDVRRGARALERRGVAPTPSRTANRKVFVFNQGVEHGLLQPRHAWLPLPGARAGAQGPPPGVPEPGLPQDLRERPAAAAGQGRRRDARPLRSQHHWAVSAVCSTSAEPLAGSATTRTSVRPSGRWAWPAGRTS